MKSGEEIDGLYRLPLASFTAERNALAKKLKAQGQRAEAEEVAGLEKPAASAWAVNQLYWAARGEFDAWLAAAARLAAAQRSGGPEAFREAQRARREALLALMRRAEEILAEGGHAATPATLDRVSRTLEALAARGGVLDAGTTLGRITGDLEPPGFDAFAGLAIAAPAASGATRPKPASPGKAVAEAKARRDAIEEAKQAVARAEAEVRRRRKAVAEAAASADTARREQQDADRELHEASQRARRATEAAEKAGFAARQAGTALAEAERATEAARAALDRRKREL